MENKTPSFVFNYKALNPIKKFILDKSLHKYRLIFKNLKDQVLKIYTIEFEQFYKTHSTEISYSSIENFVWDFFTYAEMCLSEQNNIGNENISVFHVFFPCIYMWICQGYSNFFVEIKYIFLIYFLTFFK